MNDECRTKPSCPSIAPTQLRRTLSFVHERRPRLRSIKRFSPLTRSVIVVTVVLGKRHGSAKIHAFPSSTSGEDNNIIVVVFSSERFSVLIHECVVCIIDRKILENQSRGRGFNFLFIVIYYVYVVYRCPYTVLLYR